MLAMVFTVDDEPPHSGFSLGHIDVAGSDGTATTRGHVPDQRVMVYLSAAQLLWDVQVLVDGGKGERAFVGADSSFTLTFGVVKKRGMQIETRYQGKVVDTSSVAEFTAAALTSALELYSVGEQRVAEDRSPLEDLGRAILKYEAWQAETGG